MPLPRQTGFSFNHVDQQDDLYLVKSEIEIKQALDSRAEEVRVALNNLATALEVATDGNSGADNIGATSIAGLTGATVQAILESMKLQLDNATVGQIPDFSLSMAKFKNYKRVVDASTKNAQGYYSTIRFRRPEDDTLAVEMVGSNPDANGYYQTDTWKFYDAAGSAVLSTVTWTYGYDADGNVILATPA